MRQRCMGGDQGMRGALSGRALLCRGGTLVALVSFIALVAFVALITFITLIPFVTLVALIAFVTLVAHQQGSAAGEQQSVCVAVT